jgi:hypothetical protein
MGKIGKILKGGLTGGLVGAAKAGGVGMGDIARNGGFGLMGLALAKKKKAAQDAAAMSGRPMAEDIMVAQEGPAMKKGGKVKKSDIKQDKAMIASAVHKHERAKHKGQPLTKMAAGGSASKRADGCATKGKTKGKFV